MKFVGRLMKQNKICKYCIYRVRGECYFNPPTVIGIGYDVLTVRPKVDDDDRCAQWKIHPRFE